MCARSFVLVLAFSLAASSQAELTFAGLGDLGGGATASRANAVSYNGSVVVGNGVSAIGHEAFRWTSSGGMQGLGSFPGGNFYSDAYGVSADGTKVAGSSSRYVDGIYLVNDAYLWTQAKGMVSVNDPYARSVVVTGLSADGNVIFGGGIGSKGRTESFYWTKSAGMVYMGGPNSGPSAFFVDAASADGRVLGGVGNEMGVDAPGQQAYLWTADDDFNFLPQLQDASRARTTGISADGLIAVGWSGTFSWSHPVIWQSGVAQDLGMVGEYQYGAATGVSADGRFVVGTLSIDSTYESFLWSKETGMQTLSNLAEQNGKTLDGWTNLRATAISGDGTTIVGYGNNSLGIQEAFSLRIATVPEPTSLLVLGLGVAGLVRKRKNA